MPKINRFTQHEMDKVNVVILDKNRAHLLCRACGQAWSPDLRAGGHLPRGYWKCPNNCNTDA